MPYIFILLKLLPHCVLGLSFAQPEKLYHRTIVFFFALSNFLDSFALMANLIGLR
jgi:hypothetical protein